MIFKKKGWFDLAKVEFAVKKKTFDDVPIRFKQRHVRIEPTFDDDTKKKRRAVRRIHECLFEAASQNGMTSELTFSLQKLDVRVDAKRIGFHTNTKWVWLVKANDFFSKEEQTLAVDYALA